MLLNVQFNGSPSMMSWELHRNTKSQGPSQMCQIWNLDAEFQQHFMAFSGGNSDALPWNISTSWLSALLRVSLLFWNSKELWEISMVGVIIPVLQMKQLSPETWFWCSSRQLVQGYEFGSHTSPTCVILSADLSIKGCVSIVIWGQGKRMVVLYCC